MWTFISSWWPWSAVPASCLADDFHIIESEESIYSISSLEKLVESGTMEEIVACVNSALETQPTGQDKTVLLDAILDSAIFRGLALRSQFALLMGEEQITLDDVMEGIKSLRPSEDMPPMDKIALVRAMQRYLDKVERVSVRRKQEVIYIQMINLAIEQRQLLWTLDAIYEPLMKKLDEFEQKGFELSWYTRQLRKSLL